MDEQNQENLREFLEKFLDRREAEQAAEDIHKGEQMLAEYPAPQPDDMLLASIKRQMADALPYKRENNFRRVFYKTVSVAAVFILLSVISVMLFNSRTERLTGDLVMSAVIWESEDISADDANLATLIAETEEIEGEMLALELGENGGNG
ncbi:MAG: hypothetical protein ACYS9Y_12730, partial [Planctomycetota bacterium]